MYGGTNAIGRRQLLRGLAASSLLAATGRGASRTERSTTGGDPRRTIETVLDAAWRLHDELSVETETELTVGFEVRDDGDPIVTVNHLSRGRPSPIQLMQSPASRLPIDSNAIPDRVRGEATAGNGDGTTSQRHDDESERVSETYPVEVHTYVGERLPYGYSGSGLITPQDHSLPSGNVFNDAYHPLAGGGAISGGCSMGVPASDANGSRFITTAAHCVDDNEIIYQPDRSGTPIGRVADVEFQGYSSFDGALIELVGNAEAHGGLAGFTGGTWQRLDGVLTWRELLRDVLDPFHQERYHIHGNRTGINVGAIGGVLSVEHKSFYIRANAGPGDSGAPAYAIRNGDERELLAAGSVVGPQTDYDHNHYTVCSSYERFEDVFGVDVL